MSDSKILRQTFAIPKQEVDHIAQIQEKLLYERIVLNKSEIVRLGLHIMLSLENQALAKHSAQLEHIKAGRPKKSGR